MSSLMYRVESISSVHGIVQGWIDSAQAGKLAGLNLVRRITPPDYLLPRAGVVLSEGDSLLRADEVRSLGWSGSNVRIGVISVGANSLLEAQTSGELPADVRVFGATNCDRSVQGIGCEEGVALLEIVHDLAPAATLGFCAATTTVEFTSCIDLMESSFAADIIVDDLVSYTSPYFEDGIVASTVAAIADRVTYVTSAGNDALGHYEAGFQGITVEGLTLHDFGAVAGTGTDPIMSIRVEPGAELLIVLQWNDRFGASGNDYDMYLLDESLSNLLCSTCASTIPQNGSTDPLEGIHYVNQTGSPVYGQLVVNLYSGAPRQLEMFLAGSSGGVSLEYNVPRGSIFGHAAVPRALTVGAVNALDLGVDDIEPFSSRGPAQLYFPGADQRLKPDVVAVDNVAVSGAGGFPTRLLGTSGASPHVAAIAGLLQEAFPDASPAEIRYAIQLTAHDLGPTGQDNTYGTGRVDASAAFAALPLPGLVNPSAGSSFTGRSTTFQWDPMDHNVQGYWLSFGSSQGANDIGTSGELTGSQTTYTFDQFPTDGRMLYVRFFYKIAGIWSPGTDYAFLAARPPAAAMPLAPNGVINVSTPSYVWNAVADATWYYLWV
ncbi:MAG: S8 family serine peptidase, partial [Gammaproteobacteria bacterium]|nr:S8 family serine peptidase [Gammaproteobacteria bacterium]